MRDAEHETYRLHAKLPAYGRAVQRAQDVVRHALDEVQGKWAVGCSGGKDSVALTHLALSAGWRGDLFHFHFEETPPENTAMVIALADRFGVGVETALVQGDFETLRRIGHFFAMPETADEKAAVREGERRYKAEVESAARRAGYAGLFWGLRKEESRARAITLAKYGMLYRAKTRETWTACPLATWSARDVWAYLIAHELPWLPVYDASEDRERERSETTWLGFDQVWLNGQGQRLRERDPALWVRLCLKWPELRRLG